MGMRDDDQIEDVSAGLGEYVELGSAPCWQVAA